jgi:peptide/nickel transport system substrate-binding protein
VATSDDRKVHPYIPKLVDQLEAKRVDRREFLRTATLLGLSAPAAYGIVGRVLGDAVVPSARAQGGPQQGGVLKISQRVPELKNPHTFSWVYDSNIVRQVNDYLTRTGHDNITRPWLVESWEVSDDLKTWTLNLRPDVTWNNGEAFVADHAIWNLERVLDPDVGSSVVGLMQGYMLSEEDGKTVLWDANAIEKVDDHTIRLNAKEPQLAVPEHLFHYPLLILHPEENGEWGAGSVGTGAFTAETIDVGKLAVVKRRSDGYWGEGPHLDEIHFVDHGDDEAAQIAALASNQVHGQYEASITQYEVLKTMPHLQIKEVVTAQTGVARTRTDAEPFGDPRVRKAMRMAVDTNKLLQIGHLGLGAPGEHHHVAPVHPEYADIGFMEQDIEGAKALLAEAGFENGFSTTINAKKDPAWELITVQAMQQMWREIGVDVQIEVLPSSQFWEVWDKVPFGFTPWTHRPLGIMVLGLAYRTGVPWNESGYSNPEFDRLLLEAEGTLDVGARREVMAQLEQILLDDGPLSLSLWRSLFSFWDKKVQNFEHHPTNYIFGETLWLDESA